MQIFTENLKGATKVVGQGEVANLSLQGWRLVYIYQESSYMSFFEQEAVPSQNGYGPTTVSVQKYRPSVMTWFVMHQSEASALEGLSLELSTERSYSRSLREAVEKDKKAAEETAKRIKQLEAANDVANKDRTRISEERERYAHTARKLEADIAKLRNAVGALKMKEILEQAE